MYSKKQIANLADIAWSASRFILKLDRNMVHVFYFLIQSALFLWVVG